MDEIVRTFLVGALTPVRAPDWETPRLVPPDEDNSYTQLAEDLRQGEVPHLKCQHLLPGDLVRVEGWVLHVRDVRRHAGKVAIDFDLDNFMLIAHEDRLVEVVKLASSLTCSTRGGGSGLWL